MTNNVSRKPLSPAESGAKALGEIEQRFPPVFNELLDVDDFVHQTLELLASQEGLHLRLRLLEKVWAEPYVD